MKEKQRIAVYQRGSGTFRTPGKLLDIIHRIPWLEIMGNFNPMFCRYKKKEYLVKSELGDVSDPFRREECYLSALYIEV